MTMDGCERRKTEPLFVFRFMTTVQSSLGWRKPTLRFIVKTQAVGPRVFDVKIEETLNK
jgi:hypothetical protein